jgi:hypothetical protein
VPLSTNDKQVRVEVGSKPDYVPHGAARQDMGMKTHVAFFRHYARTLDCVMKSMAGCCYHLANFSDEFLRHIGYFLDANHVKISLILLGYVQCQR